MTDNATFVEFTYNAVALAGVVIIIYIMQTVENDRIGRIDPHIVRLLRRIAFTGTALALCYSVISNDWNKSLPILLLVSAGVLNLAVNAVSLHLRAPTNPGSKARNHSFHTPHLMARLVRYFSHR